MHTVSGAMRRLPERVNRAVDDPGLLRIATLFFLAVGVIARIRQYFVGRSLWVDEAMLTHNILGRDYVGLLQPLDDFQGAPVLFLWAEKLATQIAGTGELALRFVPLISGLAALVLFALLVRRVLSPFAAALALLLFAFSRQLIWYSNETKQYAGDVLVSVMALWMFVLLRQARPRPWHWMLATALGAGLIFFSHPSIIVLGSVALIGFIVAWREGQRSQRTGFFVAGVVWGAAFLVNYVAFTRAILSTEFLTSYWAPTGFMPPLSSGMDVAIWFGDSVRGLFFNTLGLGLDPLAIVAGLAGLIVLSRHDAPLAAMLLLPVAVTFIAAMAQVYPFDDRLILFLAPMTAIAVGVGADWLFELLRPRMALLGWMFVILLIGQPILVAGYNVLLPRYREELAPVMERVAAARQPDDTMYVYYAAEPGFRYYAPRYGIALDKAIVGANSRGDWQPYYADLDRLAAGGGRVWLIYSHIFGSSGLLETSDFTEDSVFLEYLEKQGLEPIEEVREFGAVAYLFDFGRGE